MSLTVIPGNPSVEAADKAIYNVWFFYWVVGKAHFGTIHELLGYRDAKTTMIYTYVLNCIPKGVRNPIDEPKTASYTGRSKMPLFHKNFAQYLGSK